MANFSNSMFICCSRNRQFVVDSLHSIGNNPKNAAKQRLSATLCSQTKGHESGLFYWRNSVLRRLCLRDSAWTLRFNFRFNFNDFRLFFFLSTGCFNDTFSFQNKILFKWFLAFASLFTMKSPSHRVAVIDSSMAIAWKLLKISSAFRMRTSSIYCISVALQYARLRSHFLLLWFSKLIDDETGSRGDIKKPNYSIYEWNNS